MGNYLSEIVKEAIRHSDRIVVFVNFMLGRKNIKKVYVKEGDTVYTPCGSELTSLVSFIANAVATGDIVYRKRSRRRGINNDYITNAVTDGEIVYLYEIIHVENRRLRKTTIIVFIYEFNVHVLKTWSKILKRYVYMLN